MWRMALRHSRVRSGPLGYVTLLGAFLLAVLFFASASSLAQSATSDDGPLQPSSDVTKPHFIDNDAIIKMSKAGLDDDGHYPDHPDAARPLRHLTRHPHHAQERWCLAAGHRRHAGAHRRPGLSRQGQDQPAPLSAGVDEIGVYYQDKRTGEWLPLKTERVQFKSGGWAKSTFTHNIVKQDMNGLIDGPKSPLVLPTGVNILIYAPTGTQAEEYDLLRFREHTSNREFRVKTGGVFHSESGSERDEVEFHPHKLAPQMYMFTVPVDIEKGEYGVLPPGSSNVPGISNAGKIFTFSIRE